MSVSFFANRQKLLDAYNDVLNDKSDTDWWVELQWFLSMFF